MVANPLYGVPQKPFTGVYTATPVVLNLSADDSSMRTVVNYASLALAMMLILY